MGRGSNTSSANTASRHGFIANSLEDRLYTALEGWTLPDTSLLDEPLSDDEVTQAISFRKPDGQYADIAEVLQALPEDQKDLLYAYLYNINDELCGSNVLEADRALGVLTTQLLDALQAKS